MPIKLASLLQLQQAKGQIQMAQTVPLQAWSAGGQAARKHYQFETLQMPDTHRCIQVR